MSVPRGSRVSHNFDKLPYFGNLDFNTSLSACKGFAFPSNALSPWEFFFNVKIKTRWLCWALFSINSHGAA